MDELPWILWAHRTTSQKPTGVSSFALMYGMEAIIPIKIEMPTVRTEIHEKANAEVIDKDLYTTNKLRETTAMRMTSYQQRLANLHNRLVKPRTFVPRELVLRRVFENTANPANRKFQLNWEGSYMVVQVETTGSYALSKTD